MTRSLASQLFYSYARAECASVSGLFLASAHLRFSAFMLQNYRTSPPRHSRATVFLSSHFQRNCVPHMVLCGLTIIFESQDVLTLSVLPRFTTIPEPPAFPTDFTIPALSRIPAISAPPAPLAHFTVLTLHRSSQCSSSSPYSVFSRSARSERSTHSTRSTLPLSSQRLLRSLRSLHSQRFVNYPGSHVSTLLPFSVFAQGWLCALVVLCHCTCALVVLAHYFLRELRASCALRKDIA